MLFFICLPVVWVYMGAYNTVMFIVLLVGTGLLWLISLLVSAPLVDIANLLIDSGVLSVYTADAFGLVLNLMKLCLPGVVIVLVVWYISSGVDRGERV